MWKQLRGRLLEWGELHDKTLGMLQPHVEGALPVRWNAWCPSRLLIGGQTLDRPYKPSYSGSGITSTPEKSKKRSVDPDSSCPIPPGAPSSCPGRLSWPRHVWNVRRSTGGQDVPRRGWNHTFLTLVHTIGRRNKGLAGGMTPGLPNPPL